MCGVWGGGGRCSHINKHEAAWRRGENPMSVRLAGCESLSGPHQPCNLVTGHVSSPSYFLMYKIEIIISLSKGTHED